MDHQPSIGHRLNSSTTASAAHRAMSRWVVVRAALMARCLSLPAGLGTIMRFGLLSAIEAPASNQSVTLDHIETAPGNPRKHQTIAPSRYYGTMALIVACGAFLRLHNLSTPTLWFGELCSWEIIRKPRLEMIRTAAADLHPPLYYLFLKKWVILFGDSVSSMRIISVFIDIITILIICRFAHDLYEGPHGHRRATHISLLAAAISTLSLSQIIHAREVRMYSLGTLLAAVSSWALWRVLHSYAGKAWWLSIYAVSAIGLIYTHNYGVFTVAAQGICAFFSLATMYRYAEDSAEHHPVNLSWVVIIFGIVLIAYSFWLPILVQQQARVVEAYPIPPLDIGGVTAAVEQTLTGEDTIVRLVASMAGLGAASVAVVLISLLISKERNDLYLFILSVTPLSIAVSISLLQGRNIVAGRYLSLSLPFWIIAAARLLMRIRPAGGRVVITGLLLTSMMTQAGLQCRGGDTTRQDGVRAAIEEIAAGYRQGDIVLSLDPNIHLAVRYYLRDRGVVPCILDGIRPKPNQGDAVFPTGDYTHLISSRTTNCSRAWMIACDKAAHKLGLVIPHSTLIRWRVAKDSAPQYGTVYLRLYAIHGGSAGRRT